MNTTFEYPKVLYRDVVFYRVSKENQILTKNGIDEEILKIISKYRTMLLTSLLDSDELAFPDAVSMLRDILLESHQVLGNSWDLICVELNALFFKNIFVKRLTVPELAELLNREVSNHLTFADPIDIHNELGLAKPVIKDFYKKHGRLDGKGDQPGSKPEARLENKGENKSEPAKNNGAAPGKPEGKAAAAATTTA